MNREQYSFASLSALVDWINATPKRWNQDESTCEPSQSWDLNAGYEGALRMARDGWHDGARNLKAKLESLRATYHRPTRDIAPAGSRPIAARYATGNPRCMVRTRPSERPKPALTIACAVNATAMHDAECMANYGLALASVVEKLCRMGYPVKVQAVVASALDDSKTRHVTSWTVKSINAPINFADLAFSIGHPAAFRRLGFAVRERAKCAEQWGYGRSVDATAEDVIGRNVIILNGMRKANSIARTPEQALENVEQAVQEAMAALGV